jgi:hypothetical protein
VFVHEALSGHAFGSAHSSTSEHDFPFPEKPGLQKHLNDPDVFEHCALLSQSLLPLLHSSMSEQENPSPVYPALQEHEYPSAWSVHAALTSQSSVPVAHSSTSAGVVVVGFVALVAGGRVTAGLPRLPLSFFFFLPPPDAAEFACESAISCAKTSAEGMARRLL